MDRLAVKLVCKPFSYIQHFIENNSLDGMLQHRTISGQHLTELLKIFGLVLNLTRGRFLLVLLQILNFMTIGASRDIEVLRYASVVTKFGTVTKKMNGKNLFTK